MAVRVCSLISAALVLQEIIHHFAVLWPDVGAVKCRWSPGGGLGLPEAPLVTARPGHVVRRGVGGVALGGDLVNLVLVEPVIHVVISGVNLFRDFIVVVFLDVVRLTLPDGEVVPGRWSGDLGSDGHILSLVERDEHGIDPSPVPGRPGLGGGGLGAVLGLVPGLQAGGLHHVRLSVVRSPPVWSCGPRW